MAGLKFFLGLLPNTSKYEESQDKLQKELQEYREYENSPELKHFLELENEMKSADFASRKKHILTQNFKQTDEFRKFQEYKALEKSKEIKNYFKVRDSKQLADFNSFKNSETLRRYEELEKFVKSDAPGKAKANLSPKEYASSEEGIKEKEFIKLSKSKGVKTFFKFRDSVSFRLYNQIEGSEKLKRYVELKEYINSSKYREVKEYMDLPAKKKYERSEEFKREKEYVEIKSSPKINWFFKTKKSYPFGELEKWQLIFSDEFSSGKLDDKKWMTRYLYGDKLLDKNYVLADDKHVFTDGKNVEFYSNKLRILTRPEHAKGLVWDPMKGFFEKDFSFTSGLISTGNSFKKKYGRFEAKVKIGNSAVTQAFSLLAEQMLPHVDVLRYEGNKLKAGNFWKSVNGKNGVSNSQTKTGGSKYTNDYFIYSLDWAPGKLIWKINGVKFKEQTQGVPDQEMYMIFNSSLKQNSSEAGLPSALEIDWVRVYDKKG